MTSKSTMRREVIAAGATYSHSLGQWAYVGHGGLRSYPSLEDAYADLDTIRAEVASHRHYQRVLPAPRY